MQASPKEDVALLIKTSQDDKDPRVTAEAIRLLGRYPGRDEALRVLHDTLVKDDATMSSAALDALEMKDVVNSETSPRYLLDAVQPSSPLPPSLKERAARLSSKLKNYKPARVLAKPYSEAAERTPRDANAHVALGDVYKRLGSYDDAINAYKKAESVAPGNAGGLKGNIRDQMARCYALKGEFENARKRLGTYRNLSAFADDPDFAEMKANPKYAALFEAN
jgi:tetratricopeptide (TPR) repeat protein